MGICSSDEEKKESNMNNTENLRNDITSRQIIQQQEWNKLSKPEYQRRSKTTPHVLEYVKQKETLRQRQRSLQQSKIQRQQVSQHELQQMRIQRQQPNQPIRPIRPIQPIRSIRQMQQIQSIHTTKPNAIQLREQSVEYKIKPIQLIKQPIKYKIIVKNIVNNVATNKIMHNIPKLKADSVPKIQHGSAFESANLQRLEPNRPRLKLNLLKTKMKRLKISYNPKKIRHGSFFGKPQKQSGGPPGGPPVIYD